MFWELFTYSWQLHLLIIRHCQQQPDSYQIICSASCILCHFVWTRFSSRVDRRRCDVTFDEFRNWRRQKGAPKSRNCEITCGHIGRQIIVTPKSIFWKDLSEYYHSKRIIIKCTRNLFDYEEWVHSRQIEGIVKSQVGGVFPLSPFMNFSPICLLLLVKIITLFNELFII